MSALDSVFKLCEEGHMVHDSILANARAELATLRYRIAMLEVLDGDDGLIAANRLMDACERGYIPQQLLPDIQEARNEIVALRDTAANQARQLAEAREIFENIFKRDWSNGKINDRARAWLAALRDVSQRRLEDSEAIEKKCAALRATVAEQARQLETARKVMTGVLGFFDYRPARSWLAANPAPKEVQDAPQ